MKLRVLRYTLLLSALFGVSLLLWASLPSVPTGTWVAAGNLSAARSGACTVALSDGRLLISGGADANGPTATADLFSTTGSWSAAASMNSPRSHQSCAVLQDGRVLVAGGTTSGGGITNSMEMYDPSADSWAQAGVMNDARSGATASVLQDGRVLIAGGQSSGGALNTFEIFDPSSGTFSNAGTMSSPRQDHAVAVLSDGRVLIAGGSSDGANALATTDIYDPQAGSVSAGPAMSTPRARHTATTLLDGTVVVIGGSDYTNDLASAEFFDPAANNFNAASSLATARSKHSAFLLPKNNEVLVVGGQSAGADLASAELYIPWQKAFQATGVMATPRSDATGAALTKVNGRLLIAGGSSASAELYGFATVKTDAADYPPGTTVNITGTGWQPGETVTLTLVESPLIDTHGPYPVVADAFGNISNSSFVTDLHDVNVKFTLTADGSSSKWQAQNTFTDAPQKPTSTITFPADGASYQTSAWTSGAPIAGTATFATGTTSRAVNVSIKRNSTGKYWNGTSFSNSTETGTSLRLATLSGSAWTLAFPASNFPADDSYTVHSVASDSNGTENGTTTSTFTLDNVAPAAPTGLSLAAGSDTGSSQSDGITNLTTNLNFSGMAEAKSTVNLFVDGSTTSAGSGATGNGGNWNNITAAGTLSEGTHTIRATATDQAGNVSVLSSPSTITIDTTVPTMGLTPASGTVNTPFSFTWSITDPTSGGVSSGVNALTCLVKLDGTTVSTACSGNHSITTGGAHTVAASATDVAGNTGSDTRTYTVITDNQAPVVTISFAAPDGQNNWYVHSPVLGTVSANDTTTGNSNVTAISCTDGANALTVSSQSGIGTPTASGSLSVSGEGTHNISCQATDSAGNTGAFTGSTAMPVVVKIDTVAPTLTVTRLTAANGNGWNNTDVSVRLACTDGTSGVASIAATGATTGSSATSPLDVTVTSEGASQSISGSCKDNAGNSAAPAGITDINIDKTKPVITGGRTPAANANGWNNTDVTVNFTCAETGAVQSGIDTNTVAGTTVTTEGQNQSATNTGSCVDKAGNAADAATVSGINIDKTPPNAPTPVRTPASNVAGWNNTDVNVSFTSNGDAGAVQSGIDSCTTSSNLTAETSGTDVSGTCTDKAGNVSAVAKVTVKIDKTKPVITGSRNPAPNGFGWNNVDVTVGFTCAETGAVQSGIATNTVAGATVSTEGANQTVTNTGNCVDVAGNAADPSTVSGINIDKTPPNAPTPGRTPAANVAGWNNTDVNVSFTSNGDAGAVQSGIDSCTTSSNLTAETSGTDVSGTCTDKAGNVSAVAKVTVKIDKTKPVITGSRNPAPNAFGWNNTDVTVNFTCAETGAVQSGIATNNVTGATVSTEGANQSVANTGNCVDVAGNAADPSTVSNINIDKTKPTASAARDVPPNAYGWNNTDVTVTFTGNDSLSGIASCDTAVTLSSEGAGQSASGTCRDKADNVSDAVSVTGINIDKTKPVITGSRAPLANAYGWNNTDVTVSFACADALSGIASNTVAGATLSGEGAGQFVNNSGTCTDKAGNTADSQTVSGINIDKTKPTASAARNVPPNAYGWNNTDVTVTFTGNDSLSGIASCDTAVTLSSEGAGQSASGTCRDKADNVSDAVSVTGINIDKTKPVITGSRAPLANAYGWNNTDVTVSFACADAGSVQSGININTVAGATLSGEGAGQFVNNSGTCTDKAGNAADSQTVSGINIDKTNPTITLTITPGSPAVTGWYNISTGKPTVTFTCGDSLSGVASCTPQVFVGEGANQTISGTAMDKAGNSASTSIMHVNVDVTAPTINLVNPASSGNYILNQSAAASYSCSDSGSSGLVAGSAGCGGPVASGSQFDTASVGSKNFTVNAKDVAGNTALQTNTYGVFYSTGPCLGDLGHTVLQPINASGTMSVFKLGSTVPTKFRVCDANGVSIGTPGVVVPNGYGLLAAASSTSITVDEDVYSTTPDTAFRWDPTGQQWIFNQSTKNNTSLNHTGAIYYFGIHLNDDSWIYFQYGLK